MQPSVPVRLALRSHTGRPLAQRQTAHHRPALCPLR
ncbi:Uncharacterised protein [Vibrio cholerae]|nr:Uncharacterised protein [Vibrio cholerae]CSI78744.1 Uncharacterised protein [Vibrio cholerae]